MEKFFEIFRKIRYVDLYGSSINMRIDKEEKHKTVFGALLSLLVYTILAYKTLIWLKNIITKEDFKVSPQFTTTTNDTIKLQKLNLTICPSYSGIFNVKPEDMFEFRGQYLSNETVHDGSLLRKNCKEFIPTLNENIGIHTNLTCYCLSLDPEYPPEVQTYSTLEPPNMYRINLALNYSYIDKFNSNPDYYSVNFFFDQLFYNFSNYHKFVSYKKVLNRITLDPNQFTEFEIFVNKVEIKYINDAMSLGIFEPNITTETYYEFQEIRPLRNYDAGYYGEWRGNLKFKHSKNIKIFEITSFSLDQFISNFGGYFNAILLFFNFISYFYNSYSLDRRIKNKLSRGTINPKVSELIDKIISSLEVSENDKQIQRGNYVGNPSPNNKSGLSVSAVNKSANSSLNEEKSSIKNLNSSKNLTIFKSNLKATSKATELGIISPIKDHKISQFTKFKFKSKNKKLKEEDIIYNDFETQNDHMIYYQLLKEFKILKFILLDFDTYHFIDELNSFPFSIGEFEKYIKSKCSHMKEENTKTPQGPSLKERLIILKEYLS